MLALASDFDSTLYFYQKGFYRADLMAVSVFQAQGHLFGLNTGRSQRGITDVTKGKVPFDFYILENGSLILDRDLNEIYSCCMPKAIADALLDEYVHPKHYLYVVHASDTVWGEPASYADGTSIEDIRDMDPNRIFQVSMACEDYGTAAATTAAINAKYGEAVNAFQNKKYIDIISKGCSKGHGLEIVRDAFEPEIMAGIGDSYNDLPMLEAADTAFAMSAAPAEVKDKANHVVGSVADAIDILLQGDKDAGK